MLSDQEILNEIFGRNIVIEPFIASQLNTNSYDVRMGNWIVRQRRPSSSIVYNTKNGASWMWEEPIELDDEEWVELLPGETILCHTKEVIGGQNDVTTEMRAKSTIARYGLSVCKCAGLGDVGFISKWTMEMTNHSNHVVMVPVGERVAQILFHKLGTVRQVYSGRYGQGEWTPLDMLPKGKN